jgi:hypothetical protein
MRISKLLSIILGVSGFFQFSNNDGDAGGNGGTPAPASGGTGGAPRELFSREYVSELREENKSWRLKIGERDTENTTLKARIAELEEGGKTAAKQAQADADARVLRAELKAVAAKHGVVDVSDALKVLDLSGVKLDENGNLVGADELFDAAKKAKPYLFGTTNTSSTQKTPPAGDPKPVDVRSSDPKDYEAAKAAYLKSAR